MDKKKIIYIGIILIVTVITSITYFSYAFFVNKDEQHGKLNIVAGTLNYKVSSSLLNNNSITLAVYEKARLNIEIESLNNINSKYELYYTTTNNSIEIGYSTDNQQSSGIINANSKRVVTVIIKNPTSSNAVVTFGVQGGFTNNAITLVTGTQALSQYQGAYCTVEANTIYNFNYTGNSQDFNTPCSGTYNIELWGAQGGNSICNGSVCGEGGAGGYTKGLITLSESQKLYLYVGGSGQGGQVGVDSAGGYNGGGSGTSDGSTDSGYEAAGAGGGATDVRLVNGNWNSFDSLKSRIMVSAGGGGSSWKYTESSKYSDNITGWGGGLEGKSYVEGYPGGTQVNGYKFGEGKSAVGVGCSDGVGGSGSGYYGGMHKDFPLTDNCDVPIQQSGTGGSSFISGYVGCDAIASNSTVNNIIHTSQPKHYSGQVFTNGVMIDGAGCDWSTGIATNCGANQPQPNGINEIGHTGDGYARITFINEIKREEKVKMAMN